MFSHVVMHFHNLLSRLNLFFGSTWKEFCNVSGIRSVIEGPASFDILRLLILSLFLYIFKTFLKPYIAIAR